LTKPINGGARKEPRSVSTAKLPGVTSQDLGTKIHHHWSLEKAMETVQRLIARRRRLARAAEHPRTQRVLHNRHDSLLIHLVESQSDVTEILEAAFIALDEMRSAGNGLAEVALERINVLAQHALNNGRGG
jgi:hypothetical protein